jgi:hypothetical protein
MNAEINDISEMKESTHTIRKKTVALNYHKNNAAILSTRMVKVNKNHGYKMIKRITKFSKKDFDFRRFTKLIRDKVVRVESDNIYGTDLKELSYPNSSRVSQQYEIIVLKNSVEIWNWIHIWDY